VKIGEKMVVGVGGRAVSSTVRENCSWDESTAWWWGRKGEGEVESIGWLREK